MLVIVAVLLTFGRTVGTGWVLDDETVLQKQLPYFSTLSSVLVPPAGIPQWSPLYYRPVVVASYRLDDALARARGGDLDAARRWAFHASNVLMHAVAALIAGLLARRYLAAPAASAAALWFALWPAVVEPVAWMSGRSDLWAAALLLAGLWVATGGARTTTGRSVWRWALAALLALGALLAKEVAVVWCGLLPLAWWALPDTAADRSTRRRADSILMLCAALVPVAIWWTLRLALLSEPPPPRDLGSSSLGPITTLAGLIQILLAPWPGLRPIYGAPGTLALCLAAGLLAGCAASLWFASAAARRVRLLASITLWGPLVPAVYAQLQIGPDRPLGERYVYLSSFGLALLAAALLTRVAARTVWVMTLVVALPLGVIAAGRAALWSDGETFWSAMRQAAPAAAEPAMQLGARAERAGQLDAARALYDESLAAARTPELQARVLFNLGTLDLRADDPAAGLARLDRAAALDPSLDLLPFQRGAAHYRLGQKSADPAERDVHWREAERLLRAMIAARPSYGRAHFLLGRLLLDTGRVEEARRALQRVIEVEPDGREAPQARDLLSRL